MLKMLLPGVTVCTLISGCSSAPPKSSPCIGLVVQDQTQNDRSETSHLTAADASTKTDREPPEEGGRAAGEASLAHRSGDTGESVLSKSDQLELLEISGALNALRKKIFAVLDHVNAMDVSNYTENERESVDECVGALAETRHYLDHEAELIYTIPYIKDIYIGDMVRNRIDGIVRTREIIQLYKESLDGLYQKMGRNAGIFRPEETLKHFESSIALLDKAKDVLQPYVDQ